MISFFQDSSGKVIAIKSKEPLSSERVELLLQLFGNTTYIEEGAVEGHFLGVREELLSPWSTSAVELLESINIEKIERVEQFFPQKSGEVDYNPMLQQLYHNLDQQLFSIEGRVEPIKKISNIEQYNREEALALSDEEVAYLEELSKRLGRELTDSEVFGFSQVNSEHCRHKIFNGTFIVDGEEQPLSLFQLIRKSSAENPNSIVSAYKDNCAFIEGPQTTLFTPKKGEEPSLYGEQQSETVLSLKAETHNFPTTVEPIYGAATGSGGEIRDRVAGGKGAFSLAGTAVYMTAYPRLEGGTNNWEEENRVRPWLYQSPSQILIKASNGASEYGNQFGEPLICGSIYTFEQLESDKKETPQYGFDKVIMLAGGIGYGKKENALKGKPQPGQKIVLMGGSNYRIGMGGGAVSSVATGQFSKSVELNAVQRAHPEMMKRTYNAIRALAEGEENTIISIHDHGAGGHLNCFSELVEEHGGVVYLDKLPKGDPTLSAKELIGNESQERMGLVIKDEDLPQLEKIAKRERAPLYVVGDINNDGNFSFVDRESGEKPIDLSLIDMFGSLPETVMEDKTLPSTWKPLQLKGQTIEESLTKVLQLESVASKEWLTNKVDRSAGGLVAQQQTIGEIQLPLANLGVMEVGYRSGEGVATSIGHAPAVALIDPAAGSRVAIAEALTNIVWAPLKNGIRAVSLSANWQWPCKKEGEDARLYSAVKAASDFSIALGINIPTGKDSLSMTQKYPDGKEVRSPGTVIISSVAHVNDITKVVLPLLAPVKESKLLYLPFNPLTKESFNLGGSALAQTLSQVGDSAPDITSSSYFVNSFQAVQEMVEEELLLAGHDISSGGLITALLELNFANREGGLNVNLTSLPEQEPHKVLFAESSALLLQVSNEKLSKVEEIISRYKLELYTIGDYSEERKVEVTLKEEKFSFDIDHYRDIWMKKSYLFDKLQSGEKFAEERYQNYKKQPLSFNLPDREPHMGKSSGDSIATQEPPTLLAGIVRDKGSNGEREMAWALHEAGFAVRDIHMSDLINGEESLEEIDFLCFVGGFSHSHTFGAGRGWAASFLHNPKAKEALEKFYSREETLSLGICNGCQVMTQLNLISGKNDPKMAPNSSEKFESAFVGVDIENSPSILLSSLQNHTLGVWITHGSGRFDFSGVEKENPHSKENNFKVAMRYSYQEYPANPNGSPEGIAAICSSDGRHLAMMPHPERTLYSHNWAWHPNGRKGELTHWIELFANGRRWLEEKKR